MVAELDGQTRMRLAALARTRGLPQALLEPIGADDLSACVDEPDAVLGAFLTALSRADHMRAGIAPPEYQQASLCDACGPVLLWADAPPRVKACPWCFRRKAGIAVPRPQKACAHCRHFVPDHINPPAGIGECQVSAPLTTTLFPNRLRECGQWRPIPMEGETQ